MQGHGRRTQGRADAYVTIVVYDGPHACSAAVLGRILRRLDRSRRRAVLVHRVSNETRAILLADGLWEVHQMRKPFVLPQSALWPRKPVIWGFQAQLWSLTQFRRVLFFDADHIPLPNLHSSRLTGLWNTLGDGLVAAKLEGPRKHGCFNSGMMLLRPHGGTLANMKRTAARLMRNGSRGDLELLRARCPTGWNLDQPLLNAVFSRGDWVPLTNWRTLSPYEAVEDVVCNIDTASGLVSHGDSFHYMHPARPWQQSSECALHGIRCMPTALLTPLPILHSTERHNWQNWAANANGCAVWAAIAAIWWTDFLGLPSTTRAVCSPRLTAAAR